MKKTYIYAVAALALSACSNDTENYIDEPIAAHISATIGNNSGTRATDTSWANGDEIGVTMTGRYSNLKYSTPDGNGKFTGATMYFLNKRDPVTISAYYPFAGEEGEVPEEITVNTEGRYQTREAQPQFDFLYDAKGNVTGADPEVNFLFSHKMSKLTLTFKNGNDGTNVEDIVAYEINGLVLDGTFNPLSGVCEVNSAAGVRPLQITFSEGTVKHNKAIQPLILLPQSVIHNSVTLKITDIHNQEYSCVLNFSEDSLEEGNNYQWTITVNKTELIIGGYSISEWDNEPLSTGADSVLPE